MNLSDAVELAVLKEESKEPISLKVPFHVKQYLQILADENNISLNNLISSILEKIIEEFPQPHNN